MTSRLREIDNLRRLIPSNEGCDACRGPQSWCMPTAWEAPDGTVTWTGTPEFCDQCGRDLWAAMAKWFPDGQIHTFRISGIRAEDMP